MKRKKIAQSMAPVSYTHLDVYKRQDLEELNTYEEANQEEIKNAMEFATEQVKRMLPDFTEKFPGPNSFDNFYVPGENVEWTTGFWTGEIWLAYENAKTEEERELLKKAGEIQVDSFLNRIEKRIDVDHHDMGFLYSLSCVAAYKLTGMEDVYKRQIWGYRMKNMKNREKRLLNHWG